MSLKNNAEPFSSARNGIFEKSCTSFSNVFTVVTNMVLLMRRYPEGDITFDLAMALTTSSGVSWKLRSLSGSTFTTTDRELAPKGGGDESPCTVENMER